MPVMGVFSLIDNRPRRARAGAARKRAAPSPCWARGAIKKRCHMWQNHFSGDRAHFEHRVGELEPPGNDLDHAAGPAGRRLVEGEFRQKAGRRQIRSTRAASDRSSWHACVTVPPLLAPPYAYAPLQEARAARA